MMRFTLRNSVWIADGRFPYKRPPCVILWFLCLQPAVIFTIGTIIITPVVRYGLTHKPS
jgi:hypothetical protein